MLLEIGWVLVGFFFWVVGLINGTSPCLKSYSGGYTSMNAVFGFSQEHSGPEMFFHWDVKK